jgi:hypothetical protein
LSQQVVQASHAAIEATRNFLECSSEHPHLVVCGANDESSLLKEHSSLEKQGIKSIIFYEADRNDEATALASKVVYGGQRQHFKDWKLLRG